MKRIAPDIIYSTKVWLTSIIVSPFLFAFIRFLEQGYNDFGKSIEEVVHFILLIIIVGFLFSIPYWATLMIAVRTIYNADYEEKKNKIIINIIAVGIVVLLFFAVHYLSANPRLSIPYILTLTFGIWYFKLERKPGFESTIIDHLVE